MKVLFFSDQVESLQKKSRGQRPSLTGLPPHLKYIDSTLRKQLRKYINSRRNAQVYRSRLDKHSKAFRGVKISHGPPSLTALCVLLSLTGVSRTQKNTPFPRVLQTTVLVPASHESTPANDILQTGHSAPQGSKPPSLLD